MKSIAVLLAVHNRREKTLACLRNLYAQELPEGYAIETWLTNDGCTDGTPEAVREQFPQVNIEEGDGNLYWNRGMHKAWTAAAAHKDYDYYLWLNDDTYIYHYCVEQLIVSSEQCNDQSIIVGATCGVEQKEKITYGGKVRGNSHFVVPNGKLQEAVLLNGNILLVPKYVYEILGMNDSYFHHGNGDSEYGFRAEKCGIKSYVAPVVLGECDLHLRIDGWKDPHKSLRERIREFKKPTAQKPKENFYFERKYFGYRRAIFHFVTLHLRLLFPRIWYNLRNQKN